ncbi:MAG: recombinase RecB, partial [Nitrosomonas sp.]|nr:recombinase RecB [Nitrosomonas sp.]
MTLNNKPIQKLIKPSDAAVWASCIRRAWLDKHQQGQVQIEVSDFDQLLRDSGIEHEAAVLEKLQQQYEVHEAHSIEHTRELMQQSVPVIYQGRLLDEQQGLIGYPDFLILHESGDYQAADAKLSHSANKKNIQIQLGLYRKILNNQLPALVFLGDGNTATLGDEVKPHADNFITAMRALLSMDEQPDVRYSHSKCRICPYFEQCTAEFEAKEDISLIYGIHGNSANHLASAGLSTITQLASSRVEDIPDVPYLKGHKRKHHAILQ